MHSYTLHVCLLHTYKTEERKNVICVKETIRINDNRLCHPHWDVWTSLTSWRVSFTHKLCHISASGSWKFLFQLNLLNPGLALFFSSARLKVRWGTIHQLFPLLSVLHLFHLVFLEAAPCPSTGTHCSLFWVFIWTLSSAATKPQQCVWFNCLHGQIHPKHQRINGQKQQGRISTHLVLSAPYSIQHFSTWLVTKAL